MRLTRRGERALGWAVTFGLFGYMWAGSALATWVTGVAQ